jgi:hypothetical protein
VLFRMLFRRVLVVFGGMQQMSMRDFGMVGGLFMIAGLGVFGGLAMMRRRVIVMFGSLLVMFVDVMFVNIVSVHCSLPDSRHCRMVDTSSGSMN